MLYWQILPSTLETAVTKIVYVTRIVHYDKCNINGGNCSLKPYTPNRAGAHYVHRSTDLSTGRVWYLHRKGLLVRMSTGFDCQFKAYYLVIM